MISTASIPGALAPGSFRLRRIVGFAFLEYDNTEHREQNPGDQSIRVETMEG